MFLLLDIGGTNLRLACSDDGKNLSQPIIIPTPFKFTDGVNTIAKAARQLVEKPLQAVAIGLPGPLDLGKTRTFGKHKFPDWAGKPLKEELERALAAPVFIENDTALCGLGEATSGAGQGFSIVVYVTVSTGVGGVRILDGRIDRHAVGFEPGFQIIDTDGTLVPECPAPHRLEDLIGGAQVEKRFGKKPQDITDPAVWDQVAAWLAVGLNNAIVHWSPDVIILGGPMMGSIPIETVHRKTTQLASFLPKVPPIKPASLGKIGGLHGALAFLQQRQAGGKQKR
jgi:predicted NBD/HSP70 family sugar kinase